MFCLDAPPILGQLWPDYRVPSGAGGLAYAIQTDPINIYNYLFYPCRPTSHGISPQQYSLCTVDKSVSGYRNLAALLFEMKYLG